MFKTPIYDQNVYTARKICVIGVTSVKSGDPEQSRRQRHLNAMGDFHLIQTVCAYFGKCLSSNGREAKFR